MNTISRRGMLTAAGALPFTSLSAPGEAKRPYIDPLAGYTVATAPDKLTKLVLAKPMTMEPGVNIARLVEYNLARRTPRQLALLWNRYTERDRAELAQVYATSAAMAVDGRPPILLDVMAIDAGDQVLDP